MPPKVEASRAEAQLAVVLMRSLVADPARLDALDAISVLDTPPEQGFDNVVRLATRLCAAPVALVSLVGRDRQWFKARTGFPYCETDLDRSVCKFVLAETDILQIPDLTADPRTRANPLVTGEPHIRFYAGAPLRTPEGHALGSLCVIATVPRPDGLTPEQTDDLRALAEHVSTLLDMRRSVEVQRATQEALRTSEEHYRSLFRTIDAGFCTIEMAFDADGRPADYRFLEVNPVFETQTGLIGATGRWMRELAPALEQRWLDLYGHVALTGESVRSEYATAPGRWYDVHAYRVGDPGARRVAVLSNDVSARRATEIALGASERRLSALVEAGAQSFYRMSPDWQEMRALAGAGFLADTDAPSVRWLDLYIDPADRSVVLAAIEDAIRRRGTFELEHRVRRRDGTFGWMLSRAVPILDEHGDIVEWFGAASDVTEAKLAGERQQVLHELGDRLRECTSVPHLTRTAAAIVGRAMQASRAGFGQLDTIAKFVTIEPDWMAPGMTSIAGRHRFDDYGDLRHELLQGLPMVINDVLTDPRTATDPSRMLAARVGAMVNVPVRERGQTTAMFLVHSDRPREWSEAELVFLRAMADLVEAQVSRVQAEEGPRVLNEEISHQLKNTLAMVVSIAGQTLRSIPDRAPVRAFEQRIQALTHAHDVLLRQNWIAAPAREVVQAVLASAGQADRVDVSGVELNLGPRATLSLSLVLHELATNAAKYGALSVPEGRVAVEWRLEGKGAQALVALDWVELGGPPPVRPDGRERKGFGSRLIGMGLVGTGDVDLRYPASGFQATMHAPLMRLQET